MNKKYKNLNEVFEEQTPYHFIFNLCDDCLDLGIDRITECIMIPTFIGESVVTFAGIIKGHSVEFSIRYTKNNTNFILKIPFGINVINFKYKKLVTDESESNENFNKFISSNKLIVNPLIDNENRCFNIDILKHVLGKRCVVKYIYKDIEHEEIMDFHSYNNNKTELNFYNRGSITIFNIDMPHIEALEIYELKKLGCDDNDKNTDK